MENGDYRAALSFFETSSEQDEHFKTYERMYHCYLALNERDKAFGCIETAYRLNPRSDKTAFEYACMLSYYNRGGEAEKLLREILHRNPMYKPALKMPNQE